MNPTPVPTSDLERTFQIAHLGCANCAAKMDKEINTLTGVDAASVNFATASVHVRFTQNAPVTDLTDQIDRLIRNIEPAACLVRPTATGMGSSQSCVSIENQIPVASSAIPRFWDGIRSLTGSFTDVVSPAKKRRLLSGILLFLLALVVRNLPAMKQIPDLPFFMAAYGLLGFDVLKAAIRRLGASQLFDEHFLMAIATIGAFAIGEYPEAVSVMLFYQAGEILQDVTVARSRKALRALVALHPDVARVVTDQGTVELTPEQVLAGQTILIRPGDRIPLDSTIIDGRSSLDTAALTGESVPRDVSPGDEAMAGFVNGSGLLTATVLRPYAESAVSRILKQTEEAQARKAPAEKFITRFAAIYTPAMVILAALIAFVPPLLLNQSLREWGYRALILLVISCPCALMLSIPLGYFGGIGAASARGILVKGGHYLEKLAATDQVVFDKTGTLTEGRLTIEEIIPEAGVDADQLLYLAAMAEEHSDHPLARAVREAAQALLPSTVWQDNGDSIVDYQDRPGLGILVRSENRTIVCGNARLLAAEGIVTPSEPSEPAGTMLYLAVNGTLMGRLILRDRIRTDAAAALQQLKAQGVRQTAVLSGDHQANVETLALLLSLDHAHGNLLPGDKVQHLEALMTAKQTKGSTIYVGDGINDAPVLARADVGIAFGRSGSDAAIESADVVILSDNLGKLSEAIRIARKTSRIITQNVTMALGFKAMVMVLSFVGLGSIWQAVFADVGVALLAVLNSLRVIRH